MGRRDRTAKTFARASGLAGSGDLAGANQACETILRWVPDHIGAHFLLGTLAGEAGDLDRAVVHLEQAGSELGVRYNLANAYRELSRLEDAVAVYLEVLHEAPQWAPAHYGLGIARRALGDTAGAMSAFRATLALDEDFALAWLQLSELHENASQLPRALSAAARGLAADPKSARAHRRLGLLHAFHGSRSVAEASLRAALALNPADPFGQHMLSAITGEEVARPPDAYVTELFDAFAESFDTHLVDGLGYRAPTLVADAVAALGRVFPRAADLGCGTGLSGVAVRPFCEHLVGLDLSTAMLERARERSVYDALIAGPIESLEGEFELLLAVDVFVYVGVLEQVFDVLRARCAPMALLVFTTETGASGTQLLPNGRYSHAPEAIRSLCGATGFAVQSQQPVQLRKERDSWVQGQLWVVRAS